MPAEQPLSRVLRFGATGIDILLSPSDNPMITDDESGESSPAVLRRADGVNDAKNGGQSPRYRTLGETALCHAQRHGNERAVNF